MLGAFTSQFSLVCCPYCSEQFRLRKAPFRCINRRCSGRSKEDTVLTKHWPELDKWHKARGKVLDPRRKYLAKCQCTDCQETTRERLCPNCHAALPRTIGRYGTEVIAVIGAKNAGKSHYIAALIHEFRKRVGPSLQLNLSPENDFTIKRYRDEFETPIYELGKALVGTQNAEARTSTVRVPLIYELRQIQKTQTGRRACKKVINLVFFDTAGEDLNALDTMSTVNRYIYRASGIVLLLDPRQLTQVRPLIGVPKKEEKVEATDLVDRTQRLIRNGRGLSPTAMIRTPVAVAFSKFDELDRIMDPGLAIMSPRLLGRGYDESEAESISNDLQSLLLKHDEGDLLAALEAGFTDICYFGVSSLGAQKNADGTLPRVAPRRVEDPILWLLYQFGFFR